MKTRRGRRLRQRGAGKQTRFSNAARVREFSNNNVSNSLPNFNIPTKPNMSGVTNPVLQNAKKPLMEYPFTQEDIALIGQLFAKYDTLPEMRADVEKEFCIDLNDTERHMYETVKNNIFSIVTPLLERAKQKAVDRDLLKRFFNKQVHAKTKFAISDIFSRLDIPQELKPNVIKRLRCNLLVAQLKVLLD